MTRMNEPERGGRAGGPGVTERLAGAGTSGRGRFSVTKRRGMAGRSWRRCGEARWAILRRAAVEFRENDLADRAALLTFYGVLALFPALLVLVSLLGVAGESAAHGILHHIKGLTPGAAGTVISRAVTEMQAGGGMGALVAAAGLLVALVAASAYVASFVRTSHLVHDLPEDPEGRIVARARPTVTLGLTALASAGALIVIFTGGIAERAGAALGAGETVLAVWSTVKWPVLVVLVVGMMWLLHRASPNGTAGARGWLSPGRLVALVLCGAASSVFALFLGYLSAFDRAYGTLAGMIVFLLWFWIMNLAMLLGLEYDAELVRGRETAQGHPPVRAAGGPCAGPAQPDGPAGPTAARTGGSESAPVPCERV